MTNKKITLKLENTGEIIPVRITSEFVDEQGNTRYRGVYNNTGMSRIFEFYPAAIVAEHN
jgi:hypothetical protein